MAGPSRRQRAALRDVRRDTVVTAESAWRSALAVRADGSRRSAATASRWTTTRAIGNAIDSSTHTRSRLNRNIHIPASFLSYPQSGAPRRYPQFSAVTATPTTLTFLLLLRAGGPDLVATRDLAGACLKRFITVVACGACLGGAWSPRPRLRF